LRDFPYSAVSNHAPSFPFIIVFSPQAPRTGEQRKKKRLHLFTIAKLDAFSIYALLLNQQNVSS
jgi:hypothetical protein